MSERTKQHERLVSRMERARDLLMRVKEDIRALPVVTPEDVALVSSLVMTAALLEHEIGRRSAEGAFNKVKR